MLIKLVILSIFVTNALSEEISETTETPPSCNETFSKKYLSEVPKFKLEDQCVKKLHLTHSSIKNIDASAFGNLTNLEELDLQWNQLSFENLFSFKNLTKLKKLSLGHQNIWKQYVNSNSLTPRTVLVNESFPNLEELSLQGLGIFQLSTENWTTLLPKLTTLDLSLNYNPLLVGLMKNLTNIKKLDLSINKISLAKFLDFHNFEVVDVSSNKFRSLHITDDPKTCESENQLCVGCMRGLQELKAALCGIETFTIDYSSFDPVPNLKILNLYGNKLKTLGNPRPSGAMVSKLSMIDELNLRLNYFESLDVFCSFQNLSVLNLDLQLSHSFSLNISENVGECLSNLKKFYFEGNNLREIPNFLLSKLAKLEESSFGKNLLGNFSSIVEAAGNDIKNLGDLVLEESKNLRNFTNSILSLNNTTTQ